MVSVLSERIDKIIKYGLIVLILSLMFPWEIMPYPFFYLDFLDVGAGVFFETRAFLYIALGFIFFLWLLKAYLNHSFSFVKNEVNKPILLFLLVTLVSSLKLFNLRGSIDDILLYLAYFFAFWLTINYFKTFKDINLFLTLLVIGASILSFYGIYQYLVGFKTLTEFALIEGVKVNPERAFAIFMSPNNLAALLLLLFPLTFVFLLNEKAGIKRVFFIVSSILMLVSLLFTFSRGGWLCFLLSFGAVFLFCLSQKHLRKKVVATFLVILFFSFVFGAVTIQLSASLKAKTSFETVPYTGLDSESAAASASGRFYLWLGAFSLFKDYPLLGSGIGTFASVYPKYQFDGIYSKYAHSILFETLAEVGLIGTVLLLWIFYLIFKKGLLSVARLEGNDSQSKMIALFAGIFGFFLHSLIDINFQVPLLGLIFFSIVGISFIYPEACLTRRQEFSLESKEFKFTRVLFFVFVLVIFLISLGVIFSCLGYVRNNKGKELMKKDDYETAVEMLEEAVLFDPISASYRSQLAEAYNQLSIKNINLLDEAIIQAERAVDLEPRWPFYQTQLGILCWRNGNINKAQELFEQAKSLYPNDPYFPLVLGKFYVFSEQPETAVGELKEAVALKRFYKVFYPERALAAIEEAYVELGNVYVNNYGDFQKALDYYDEALKINPKSTKTHFSKGVVLQILGNLKEAEVEFKKVLEIEPENKEARRKLEEISRTIEGQ